MKKLLPVIFLLLPALLLSQYKNIQVNTLENRPNEVSIAINPTNPQNIIAGANINNYYYYFDGCLSWVNQVIKSEKFGVWGDPCLIFDSKGTAYFFHLSRRAAGEWIHRIVCQWSNDGGKTWEDPGSFTGLNMPRKQDKSWACCDNTDSKWK